MSSNQLQLTIRTKTVQLLTFNAPWNLLCIKMVVRKLFSVLCGVILCMSSLFHELLVIVLVQYNQLCFTDA